VPTGSTFVFDGQTYTVTHNDRSSDCGGWINVSPEIDLWTIPDGSYPLTIPRTFEFQDGTITLPADGGEIQYPDGTTQNSANLTGGVTFSGVQIIGSGEGSGDGNGYSTLELVPDADLAGNHQYLVIDPAGPNHIHIRAGGDQDDSNAELILGGEHAHFRTSDVTHGVSVRAAAGGTKTLNFTGRSCANYGSVDIECPPGSTFEYQGAQYSITSGWDQECNNGWLFSVTGPVPSDHPDPANFEGAFDTYWDGKSVTAQIAFTDKDWTFGNDGVLDLAGGIRFPDNSVQTTAGQPVTASWGDPNSSMGSVSFGNSSISVLQVSDFNTQAAGVGIGIYDNGSGTEMSGQITLSGSYSSTIGSTLSITRHGITFGDNTTQETAATKIVKLTQAEYDALTPDADTVYMIVG
jgi:hypothetical protein